MLCPYGYSNNSNCGECSRCMRIENGNDPEVRYIYPDGLYIKKEQLKDLQEEFNLSSIEGNRRVYVIWNCEKMNVQASNSILKFLEEPVSNIVAIKEASGNISQVAKISALCNDNLFIYSGNDDQVIPILSWGGIGVISVLSNIKP